MDEAGRLRPQAAILEQIEAAQWALSDAENEVRLRKEALHNMAESIADHVGSEQELLAVAHWLYWFMPEVNARSLAAATGAPTLHAFLQGLPQLLVDLECSSCGLKIAVKSRTDALTKATHASTGSPVRCDRCWHVELRFREDELRSARMAQEQRLALLRALPYAEYLRTPEWLARRRQAVQRARFRCNVCNSGGRLDVHHRTYERRGDERPSDLVVLCHDCHEMFHREGKLAR